MFRGGIHIQQSSNFNAKTEDFQTEGATGFENICNTLRP